MVATTHPSPEPRLPRFSGAERAAHWAGAALFAVVMATAAALYVAPISEAVGRRELMKDVHVWCGLALPLPALVAACGRWGSALRGDVRRLNRWTADDRRWLRSLGRDPKVRSGKFNAGQKLNAAFLTGAVLVMMGTGSVMRWFEPFPLLWRTGATFVHDWLAIALTAALIGHVALALRDPDALDAMWRGSVSRSWAARRAPRWLAELVPDDRRLTGAELQDAGHADGERLQAIGELEPDRPLEDG